MINDASDQHEDRHGHAGELSTRLPHAALDLASRRLKGLKIERLLQLSGQDRPLRVLEIGTGSGGIAHYFGTHPQLNCEVDAVDTCDNRLATEGYRYHGVQGTTLPFSDEEFDVVISNHVIEHVGEEGDQRAHLEEVRRVLRPDGLGYLAVPNRWMMVEPHYGLAFLSWLPRRFRSPYLRWRHGNSNSFYDCEPLTLGRIEKLLCSAGLAFENKSVEALRLTLQLEYPPDAPMRRLFARIPDGSIRAMNGINPTLVYRIWRGNS